MREVNQQSIIPEFPDFQGPKIQHDNPTSCVKILFCLCGGDGGGDDDGVGCGGDGGGDDDGVGCGGGTLAGYKLCPA